MTIALVASQSRKRFEAEINRKTFDVMCKKSTVPFLGIWFS